VLAKGPGSQRRAARLSLLGASFVGGVCAYYAAKRTSEICRLDCKKRTIDSRNYWHNDYLDDDQPSSQRTRLHPVPPVSWSAIPNEVLELSARLSDV
jgi:hypothetical protein